VAGAVDGIGYLLLHVFTAHVTGNTVHAGTRLGAGDLRDGGWALLSIALFAAGVGLGAIVRDGCERRAWRPQRVVLALSAALLAAFALLGRGLVPGATPDLGGGRTLAALAAATLGIGSQNAVGPRVGGRPVRTYITGTMIELVEALVAARRANPPARRAELSRAAALLAVWGAYLAGAVQSSVACARLGSAAAILPAGALALVALRSPPVHVT
jgi:uncharacterized membrane protein YoaK (UPF0700 family)